MIEYTVMRNGFDDLIRVWPNDPRSTDPLEVAIEVQVDGAPIAVYLDKDAAYDLIKAIRETIEYLPRLRRHEDA